jgi:polyferredoxin
MARWRRISQTLFFGLFLFLLFRTEFQGSLREVKGDLRLPYPVSIFLQADPLNGIVSALASGALYRGLLWGLVILIPTLFLGRFFCSWICPLGTLNHFLSNFKSEKKRGRRLIDSQRYQPWQKLKYYILIAVLAAALVGVGLAGPLDPISLTVRSLALSILPALNYALGGALDAMYQTHAAPLRFFSNVFHFLLQGTLIGFKQPHFRQAFLLAVLFILILAANFRVTRFWCRALCPLGGLLGLISRWSIFGLEKHAGQCEDCNRCLLHCQGGDDPIPGAQWRKAECHLCMNCVDECPKGGIHFTFFPSTTATIAVPDLRRRQALTSVLTGAAALPLFRSGTGFHVDRHDRLVRPPGAIPERDFLARCIRCSECMKVCPNNALHPSFTEAGIEGLWTPVLVARIGYCEPSCVFCGQVCPTGAIWEFTAREKAWATERTDRNVKPIRLGTAFYDHGRCLPWSMATECIVCEEWCPTSPKAIYLRTAEVADAGGKTKTVRQPYVAPELCVGCGACEYACPVADRPAVYVTSVGESRSKTNQILLRKPREQRAASPLPESGEVAGWVKTGTTRTFEAVDLWRYVDGDAERYLKAGVIRTFTSDYKFQNSIEAVADVHLMKTAAGAAMVLASTPAAGSRSVGIGDESRHFGTGLMFRKGPYYVRLVAFEESPRVAGAITSLGKAIESRVAQTSIVNRS